MMPNFSIINVACFLSLFFIGNVFSLDPTDTTTWGGDNSRTGYQITHNMDPDIVGSSEFGQIFKTQLGGTYNGVAEQIFSQPLVYTLSDGIQYIFVATTQNNIYKLNAITGVVVAKRNMHVPFMVADIDGCTDINPLIGVTATGVIDPTTDTWYLTAKTYENQTPGLGAQGRPNGRYFFHAINVNDLSERAGFPINIEGVVARNNQLRKFQGGIQHQRPALLLQGNYVYAGFASHCVKFAYMGWVIGWHKTTGAVVESYGMEGSPVDGVTQGGGVWMSGGGIASDNAGSLFFATGNGHASQLTNIPVNGRNPPSALEEAAVHMTINDDGTLTPVDFFMPYEKQELDGGDRDLGTSPLQILPNQFSCGAIKRMGVVTGKTGKTYWLDLDNMGGYQNGPNQLDAVIQTYQNENSVYAGAGVYPLEGGYVYINVIKYPTHVFKFNCVNGMPSFTKVADTNEVCAYLGVGHGTTTSLNGQAGTGLMWVSDVNGFNLRVYDAVPVNGKMNLIKSFSLQSITKFTRPVFGNGRVYMGTTNGFLYGFGSTTLPSLNCTVPEFGIANVDTAQTAKTITCKTAVGLKVASIALKDDTDFTLSELPTMPLTVAKGSTFSFKATFDPSTVGDISADVTIGTTNDVTGYSASTLASLHGTGESTAPLLKISPATMSFQAITGEQEGGVSETLLLTNSGNTALTISSVDHSTSSPNGPFTTSNVATFKVGAYTLRNVPRTIAANTVATVTVNFDTSVTGSYNAYFVINSDGGNKKFSATGTSGDPPSCLVEFQTTDGEGWVRYAPGANFTFGKVTENLTKNLKMRVTNNAPAGSADLSLQVSKPPIGVGIISAVNSIDLNEGTQIAPGESATAALYCAPPKTQWNTDGYDGAAKWTMNVNDPTFGHQDIGFVCNAVSEQAPPLLSNGNGRYRYVGCYKENNPGRQLAKQLYGADDNTIAKCVAACAAGNYAYCGTQYNRECWAGPKIPTLQVEDGNCNFPCKGNVNQICGGNGINGGDTYISLFADSLAGNTPTNPGNPTTSKVSAPGTSSTSSTTGGGSATSESSSTPTQKSSSTPTATSPAIVQTAGAFTYQGCYAEPAQGRALEKLTGSDTLTIETCASICAAYKYFGAEYGRECWCGNTLNAAAAMAPKGNAECSMLCSGNKGQYCGNGGKLSLYSKQANAADGSGSAVSSSSSSSVSSSLSASRSSASISSSSSTSAPTSALTSTSLTASTSSTTSTPSITSLSSSTSTPTKSITTSSAITAPSNTNFAYYACMREPTSGRLLPSVIENNGTSMSISRCLSTCSKYAYAGVEYGRECWCGNALNLAGNQGATAGGNVTDSECNFKCPGNQSQACGAGQRMSLYYADKGKLMASGSSRRADLSEIIERAELEVGEVKRIVFDEWYPLETEGMME